MVLFVLRSEGEPNVVETASRMGYAAGDCDMFVHKHQNEIHCHIFLP
jgi:hypothetical protein